PALASISSTRNVLMAAAFSVALISLLPPLLRAARPLLFLVHYRFFVPKINKKHFLCSATNAKCRISGLLTIEHTLYFQKYYKFDSLVQGATMDTINRSSPEYVTQAVLQLVERARAAQRLFSSCDQQRIDEAVLAVGWAIMEPERNRQLAEQSVADTG